MSGLSRGYRMSANDAANISAWTVGVASGIDLENPSFVPDWSYFHPFSATLTLSVHFSHLLRSAGLSADGQVGFMLTWSTQKVGRIGVSEVVPFCADEVTANVLIPRGQVGGTLILNAKIVLLGAGADSEEFAAREVGSVLWEDSRAVVLEGDAPRLPVVVVPSGQPPFAGSPTARWHIWVDHEDLSLPVDVAVRVSLNQANPAIAEMLDGDNPAQSQVLLASLMLDLHRELIRRALLETDESWPSDSDGSEGLRFPDGSIGAAMESDLLLLNGDFESLRNQARFRWAELDVEIQRVMNVEEVYG